jgi:hypothetical protein
MRLSIPERNKKIIKRCEEMGYELIEPYTHHSIKIKIRCKKDNYEWLCAAGNFLNSNSRCPKCTNHLQLSKEEVQNRIYESGKNIIIIGNYTKTQTKTEVQCGVCGNKWHAVPQKLINISGKRCPVCFKHKISFIPETHYEELKKKHNIDFKYNNVGKLQKIICIEHNLEFVDRLKLIFRRGKINCLGCCPVRKSRIIREDILADIKKHNPYIENMEPLKKKNSDKIWWRCKIDGGVFLQRPTRILTSNYGCPYCKNKSEKRIFDILVDKFKIQNIKHNKSLKMNNKSKWVDFYFIHENKEYIIERNGEQHYEPIRFGGISQERAEQNFIKQKERDEWIRVYCQENKINLLEIPYFWSEEEIINRIRDFIKWQD